MNVTRSEYDRFNDRTVVHLNDILLPILKGAGVGRTLHLTAFFFYAGKTPIRPPFASFTLTSYSREWAYLRCSELSFLVDGAPLGEITVERDGRVGTEVTERMSWLVNTNALIRMATAKRIEGRLCTDEFVIEGDHITALREFASLMKAAP